MTRRVVAVHGAGNDVAPYSPEELRNVRRQEWLKKLPPNAGVDQADVTFVMAYYGDVIDPAG